MALRSLVGMLKALPRRMPGSGALTLKGNPWSKNSAGLTDPTKYTSIEESLVAKRYPQIYESLKRSREECLKKTRDDYSKVALVSIVSLGSMGYIASNI